VKLVIDELKRMTEAADEYIDSHLLLYTLRRRSYDTLLDDTRLLIDEYRRQVVFIDGLVDYVESFNDEVLSRKLIHELLMLCEEYRCAIVNVLHENKPAEDLNMRGHLGTMLGQKAGSVLRCEKNKSGIINVTCPDSRHGQMPAWNISFDSEGHIVDADFMHQQEVQAVKMQKAKQLQEQRELKEQQRLDQCLQIICEHSGYILRNELTQVLMKRLDLSRPVVSKFITKMLEDGKLFASGRHVMHSADIVLPI
jgi:hypothetical protein